MGTATLIESRLEVAGWTIAHGHLPTTAHRLITGHHHPVLRVSGHPAPCFLVGAKQDHPSRILGQRRRPRRVERDDCPPPGAGFPCGALPVPGATCSISVPLETLAARLESAPSRRLESPRRTPFSCRRRALTGRLKGRRLESVDREKIHGSWYHDQSDINEGGFLPPTAGSCGLSPNGPRVILAGANASWRGSADSVRRSLPLDRSGRVWMNRPSKAARLHRVPNQCECQTTPRWRICLSTWKKPGRDAPSPLGFLDSCVPKTARSTASRGVEVSFLIQYPFEPGSIWPESRSPGRDVIP